MLLFGQPGRALIEKTYICLNFMVNPIQGLEYHTNEYFEGISYAKKQTQVLQFPNHTMFGSYSIQDITSAGCLNFNLWLLYA